MFSLAFLYYRKASENIILTEEVTDHGRV